MFVCLYAFFFGFICIILPTVSPFLLLPINEIAAISGTIICSTGELTGVADVNLCAIRVYYSNDAGSETIVRNGLWSKNVLRRMIKNQNCIGFPTDIEVGVGTCDPMPYELAVNMTLCICAETACNINLATCIASAQNLSTTPVFTNFMPELLNVINCSLPMNFDFTCSQHNLINVAACEEYVRTRSVLCSVTSGTSTLTRNAFIENNYELYLDQGAYQLVQALRIGANVTVNSAQSNVYYLFSPNATIVSEECLCISNPLCNGNITTCQTSRNDQIDATTISNEITVISSLVDSLASTTVANLMNTADDRTSRSIESLSTDMPSTMAISQSTSDSNMDMTSIGEISTVTNTMNANQVASTLVINDETSIGIMNPNQVTSTMMNNDGTETMDPNQVTSTMTNNDGTETMNPNQVTSTPMGSITTITEQMRENPSTLVDSISESTAIQSIVTENLSTVNGISDASTQINTNRPDETTESVQIVTENPSTMIDETTNPAGVVTNNPSTISQTTPPSRTVGTNTDEATMESTGIVTETPSTISDGVNTNNPTSLLTASTAAMISITSESMVVTGAIDTTDSMTTMSTSSKATTESAVNTNTNVEISVTSASISSTVSLASSSNVVRLSNLVSSSCL